MLHILIFLLIILYLHYHVFFNLIKIKFDDVKVGFSLSSNSVGVYSYLFTLCTDIDVIPYCHVKILLSQNDIQYMYHIMYILSLPNIQWSDSKRTQNNTK